MWTTSGWTVNNEYAPALHGAADLLAEWLANAVNNEKIKSDTNDRLVAMGRRSPGRSPGCPGLQRCRQRGLGRCPERRRQRQFDGFDNGICHF